MSIWTYEETKVEPLVHSLGRKSSLELCPFCKSILYHFAGSDLPEVELVQYRNNPGLCPDARQLKVCHCCGWWVMTYVSVRSCISRHDDGAVELRRTCGSLKDLDLTDLHVPTEELRTYLVGRYDKIIDIHPKKYEDLVAGVFSDFGFDVRVTSFSGDKGIDIIVLDGAGDVTVGIQVKRYKGKVKAEQIRSFFGALVLQGIPKGIFVTTASYQDGAVHVANDATFNHGLPIELIDAEKFYSSLRLAQKSSFLDIDDPQAPYFPSWQRKSEGFFVDGFGW